MAKKKLNKRERIEKKIKQTQSKLDKLEDKLKEETRIGYKF